MKLKFYQPPGDCLAAWTASRATGIFMMSGGYSQGKRNDHPPHSSIQDKHPYLQSSLKAPVCPLHFLQNPTRPS